MRRPILILVPLVAFGLAAPPARAAVVPPAAALTVYPYESASTTVRVDVPSAPKADVLLAIDTSGSMPGALTQLKAQARQIVERIQADRPDAWFAVAEFRDAADGAGEYGVRQSMTDRAGWVDFAISNLTAGGGGDAPEAHNLVFRNSYTPAVGGPIGWRAGSHKFVVVISDAEPHGAGSAGITGCADTSADPHGLNTATVLQGMRDNGRTLFMFRYKDANPSASAGCYFWIAKRGAEVGQSFPLEPEFPDRLSTSMDSTPTTVSDVRLDLTWPPLNINPPTVTMTRSPSGAIVAPASVTFTLTVTGHGPGTHLFRYTAVADGGRVGTYDLTVTTAMRSTAVTARPAVLAAATEPPGATPHTFVLSARLTDVRSGAPLANQRISFTVGTRTLCGSDPFGPTTDGDGVATCSAVLDALAVAEAGGYTARFAGDWPAFPAVYQPSTGSARLVTVDGVPIA